MNFRKMAAVSLSAAFILSACGAQPSNLPPATQVAATPTSASTSANAEAGTTSEPPAAVVPTGDRPYAAYSAEQRAALQTAPPPLTIDTNKKYIATINTSKGEIVVELNPQAAPNTVNNFVYLAQNGFYDGLTFHRVEPGFVIQGGDPAGDGTGGPGYNIPPEIKLPHVDGAIAMARQGGDPATTPSSGSQFYITMGAQPNLDNNYTVFGTTVKGLDIVKQIAIGDKINTIVITAADGGNVTAAAAVPPAPTAPPKQAACSPYVLNVQADEHILGKADAPVTIIEYGDFQCPSCAAFHAALTPTMQLVSDTVRLVFRHFPLVTVHDKAMVTSRAVEAAGVQGKFWEMHDLLYEKQAEWQDKPVTEVTATVKAYAQTLGLDPAKLEADMASEAVISRIDRDIASATALNLNGTPSLFLDGRSAPPDAFTQPDVATQIQEYAKTRAQDIATASTKVFNFATPESVISKDSKYVMTVKTSKGDIVVELDPALAPVNVNSTVFLAQKGYYDGTPILVNDPGLGAVLSGSSTAVGNPGYECDLEKPATGTMTKPGVVALFGGDAKSSAQLVLTYSATQELDGRFSVIGMITSGLDVVKSLQARTADASGDSITTVTVAEKK